MRRSRTVLRASTVAALHSFIRCIGTCALLVSLLFVSGCATNLTSTPALRFNGVEILNLTNDDIRNMQIEVNKFHRKFACGIILHRSMCMNGFHARELEENEIVITWEQRGRQHSLGPVRVKPPAQYDAERIYVVQFVLGADHQMSVTFKPARYF